MFTENLDLFLADFGVPFSSGSVQGVGIFDMPTQVISGDMVLSTEYSLTVRADQFGGLGYKSQITVNGSPYEVRDLMLVDDGAFARLSLTKLTVSGDVFTDGVFEVGVFV